MPNTSSLTFPKMFDVIQNRVSVSYDGEAVTNRTKLLLLTSPTEMYNSPEFGVGLFGNMFQYITDNNKAILKDKIVSKVEQFEPTCVPGMTDVTFGKQETDSVHPSQDTLHPVVKIGTIFGDILEVDDNV